MCRASVCKKCGSAFAIKNIRGPAPDVCSSCNEFVCEHCGATNNRRLRKDKGKDSGRFCNRKCAGAARKAGKRKGRWKEAQELRMCRANIKPSQKMHADIKNAMRRHMKSIRDLWDAMNAWRPCLHCGGPRKRHATEFTMFCSIRCSAEYEHEITCAKCGSSFVKKGVQGKSSCCKKCRRKKARALKRLQGKNIAKRAIRFGVERFPYVRAELLDRDGWTCQLCHVRLFRKWTYHKHTLKPHPANATLDHIVSMANGGADAPWNIQACCLKCNSLKSKANKGQLRFKL
jgi:hypothetical protein